MKKVLIIALLSIVSVALIAGDLQINEIGEKVEEAIDRIMLKDITEVYDFIDSALGKVVLLKDYTDRLGVADNT